MKVHKWSYEEQRKVPKHAYEHEGITRTSATLCGYMIPNTTTNDDEVTCKRCLKIINKKRTLWRGFLT